MSPLVYVVPSVVLLAVFIQSRRSQEVAAVTGTLLMLISGTLQSVIGRLKRILQMKKKVFTTLSLLAPVIDSRLNARYFMRMELPALDISPWRIIFANRRDSAFLLCMGVDIRVFDFLLHRFVPVQTRMRCRKLVRRSFRTQPHDDLAIVLHFLRSYVNEDVLSRLFGLTQATINRRIHEGLQVLLIILRQSNESRIEWPQSKEEIDELVGLSSLRENMLKNVIGFMDGLKMDIQEPMDSGIQNRMYNGYTCTTQCTNLLVFAPDGCIIYTKMNCEGSVADSEMASGVYESLVQLHETYGIPYRIVADSAFRAKEDMAGYIYKPLSRRGGVPQRYRYSMTGNAVVDEAHTSVDTAALLKNVAVVSLRQSVEWGMRSIQSVWRRLTGKLPCDVTFRGDIIECCFRLHNLNTRIATVQRNQITKVFSRDYVPNMFKKNNHDATRKLSQFYHFTLLTSRLTQSEVLQELQSGGIFQVDDEVLFNFSNSDSVAAAADIDQPESVSASAAVATAVVDDILNENNAYDHADEESVAVGESINGREEVVPMDIDYSLGL